ncbi:MAG: HdeD family acid-resistance protein [Micromonosporaceae bacterium]
MSNTSANSDTVGTEPVVGIGRRLWAVLLIFGILTFLAGVAALVWPGPTVLVVSVVFGIQLLIGGAYWFVNALTSEAKGTTAQILLAVLAIVAGVIVLRSPVDVAVLLPLVLGLFWTINGVIETFHALVGRAMPFRGWAVAGGLLSLVAGIALLAYPGIGLLTITYLLGVWLAIYGGIATVRAVRMRPHAVPAARHRPAHT